MGLGLIVHGGAGKIATEHYTAAREGCRAAVEAGWRVLLDGGTALEAVQAAIVSLEDNPGFNAGTGAVLTSDGRAQLDAGIMDGETLQAGAIAGVEHIKNPIVVARRVLSSPHVLLMGHGAEQFAVESGMALCDPSALVTPTQYARWRAGYGEEDGTHNGDASHPGPKQRASGSHKSAAGTVNGSRTGVGAAPDTPIHLDADMHGTVGAVAVDARGNVAAGASTGGIAAKYPGRIGDTPLVGCGYYAENGIGGVSSTGHGEDFIRLVLARRAVDYLSSGMPAQAAATAAIRLLDERVHGDGGLILLDAAGRVGYARNTSSMAHAFMLEGMAQPVAGV